VWREGAKIMEDNVPICWITNNILRFPFEPSMSLTNMIKKRIAPEENWLAFPVIKIKRSHG
jgi:hypothetical protein